MTTPALFDDTTINEPTAPRCRMCARQAFWMPSRQEWDIYCGSGRCTNRRRVCQQCGAGFDLGANGAGNKYCSTECKRAGYQPFRNAGPPENCAWCGAANPDTKRRREQWPYICMPCQEPIKHVVHRLKEHHLAHERARMLALEPYCEICGRDVVQPTNRTSGKKRPELVVDHDHTCCPGDRSSCGNCVRGLLCRNCNAAIGMLRDDTSIIRAAAQYLEAQAC